MSNLSRSQIISMLLLASVGLTVGCGEEKSRHPQKIRRSFKNTSVNPQMQNPVNAPNPNTIAETPTKNTPNQDQLKVQGELAQQIESALQQAKAGQPIRVSDLDEGTYTLETTTSHVRSGATGDLSDYLVTTKWNIEASPSNPQILNRIEATGRANSVLDAGREMEIPLRFQVKNQGGQAWKPARAEESALFKTAIIKNGTKLELFDSLKGAVLSVEPKSILMHVLAGQSADSEGKTLNLQVLKVANGRVSFYITVDEKMADHGGPSLTRNLIFTYRVDKLQPQVEAAPPTAQTPAAQ